MTSSLDVDGGGVGVRYLRPPTDDGSHGWLTEAAGRVAWGDRGGWLFEARGGLGGAARVGRGWLGFVAGVGVDQPTGKVALEPPFSGEMPAFAMSPLVYVAPRLLAPVGRSWIDVRVAASTRVTNGYQTVLGYEADGSVGWHRDHGVVRGAGLEVTYVRETTGDQLISVTHTRLIGTLGVSFGW